MLIPMVITALALGRSFDYKSMQSGNSFIFDQASVESNKVTIYKPFTHSHYQLIESSSDANDFFDIDGDIALKSKRNQVRLQGFGEYMIKTIDRERTVEMMVSVYHETMTETFPDYTKLRDEWRSKRPKDVGTHYIRSIVYGGRLLISYKMVADSSDIMEQIKASVSGSMSLSGRLNAKVAGNLEKLKKKMGSHYKLTIKAFATTGGNLINPTDAFSVLRMIEEYPSTVNKLNNGKGSPLKLDIVPLSTLDPKFKLPDRSSGIDQLCDEAINKYDDITMAYELFKKWERTKLWTDEQQEKIDEYYGQIYKAKKEMIHAISSLDLTQEEDLHHFDDAFEAYGIGKDNVPNRYMRSLTRLQHVVEQIPYEWFPFTGAVSHYIHWGSVNCTQPSPEPVYIGYAATTVEGYGNGGNYVCLNSNPELEVSDVSQGTTSEINGLTFQDTTFNTGPAFCAFCSLDNATFVTTIPSRKECPEDMKMEYSGFLMMNSLMESKFLCFDGEPDKAALDSKQDETATKLVPVWQKCEDCDEDEQDKFIPCVVCSR